MSTRASRMLASILVPLVAAGVTVAMGTPARAYEFRLLAAKKWAYTDLAAPTKVFFGEQIDTPIGAWRDTRQRLHSSRQYFTFDLTALAGQKVSETRLNVAEVSVNDCTVTAPVELWRTEPITTSMSWVKPPRQLEKIITLNMGAAGACPGSYEVEMASVLQKAIDHGETQITFGMRLPVEKEFLDQYGRKMFYQPIVSLYANTAPSVSEVGFVLRTPACGTIANPTFVGGIETLRAVINDPDQSESLSGQFATWPVDAPQERVEFFGSIYGHNEMRSERDLGQYPDEARIAWAARGYDGHDYSPWSAPCYVTIDKVPPTNTPIVTSPDFREGILPSGGVGVPGTFTFDAQGDPAAIAYSWALSGGFIAADIIQAPSPGAPVTMTFTPDRPGLHTLSVRSADRALNNSPPRVFRFNVRNTAPQMTFAVGGVGVPGRVTMTTSVAEVTGFSYQIGDGPEIRFPAVDRSGGAELTFPAAGQFHVTGRTYVGDRVIGVGRQQVFVNNAPTVESAEFSAGHDAVVGQPGSFIFRPRSLNVVGYQYSFDSGELGTVEAGPDGIATLTWTPVLPGSQSVHVRALMAGGAMSDLTTYSFSIMDPRPIVRSNDLVNSPRTDGIGLPMYFDITTFAPTVTEFLYSIDDGPQQTVAAEFSHARVQWTPPTAGDHVFHASSRLPDGTLSAVTDWQFHIWTGPVVDSQEYPSGGPSGQPGRQGTFRMRPGLPGVTEYLVTLPFDIGQMIVPADADGGGSFTFTPTFSGSHSIIVVSRGVDGTLSDPRRYSFGVRDTAITVSGYYHDQRPRGGVGIGGYISLGTGLYASVSEWVYWVNDGPAQTVPSDGFTTTFVLVPERSGANLLHVRYRTTDGELSPVMDYPFLVGTAPLISSTDYPEDTSVGGPGIAGEFRFSGGTAGIVEFVYRVEAVLGGVSEEVTVPASNGVAVATYIPQIDFVHYMHVQGRLADGTLTDESTYTFLVAQPPEPTRGYFS